MQLVEIDDVQGVRAAVTTFVSGASSLRFALVPLADLAEPAHYEAVREIVGSCDLAVIRPRQEEQGRAARLLGPQLGWWVWRWIGRGRNMRLQPLFDTWNGVDCQFIMAPAAEHTDPHQGRSRARRLLRHVAIALLAVPLRPTVTRFIFGQLQVAQARRAAVGPATPARRKIMRSAQRHGESIREPIRRQLVEAVRRVHTERQDQDLRVAVPESATVLPAVARALEGLGYSQGGVEWITVFAWLPGKAPPAGESRRFAQRVIEKDHRSITDQGRSPWPGTRRARS